MSGLWVAKKRRTQVIDKQFHCKDNGRTLLHSVESVAMTKKKEASKLLSLFLHRRQTFVPAYPLSLNHRSPSAHHPHYLENHPEKPTQKPPADHNVWPGIIQRTQDPLANAIRFASLAGKTSAKT